jgi:hypothetical protein
MKLLARDAAAALGVSEWLRGSDQNTKHCPLAGHKARHPGTYSLHPALCWKLTAAGGMCAVNMEMIVMLAMIDLYADCQPQLSTPRLSNTTFSAHLILQRRHKSVRGRIAAGMKRSHGQAIGHGLLM